MPCPECGNETWRGYRWVGGHGHILMDSCTNLRCGWCHWLDRERDKEAVKIQLQTTKGGVV